MEKFFFEYKEGMGRTMFFTKVIVSILVLFAVIDLSIMADYFSSPLSQRVSSGVVISSSNSITGEIVRAFHGYYRCGDFEDLRSAEYFWEARTGGYQSYDGLKMNEDEKVCQNYDFKNN